MDKQHAAKKAAYSETEISETNGLVNPTESGDSKPTTTEGSSVATDPTTDAEPNNTAPNTTKEPTATKAPTATTSTSTTSKSTPKPTSTQTQTGKPATSTQSSSNGATESQQDKTSTTTKSIETDETETETGPVPYGEYDGLYTQKGDDYTLIADKNSKYFIFINNKDNTSRKTEFTYHSK